MLERRLSVNPLKPVQHTRTNNYKEKIEMLSTEWHVFNIYHTVPWHGLKDGLKRHQVGLLHFGKWPCETVLWPVVTESVQERDTQ